MTQAALINVVPSATSTPYDSWICPRHTHTHTQSHEPNCDATMHAAGCLTYMSKHMELWLYTFHSLGQCFAAHPVPAAAAAVSTSTGVSVCVQRATWRGVGAHLPLAQEHSIQVAHGRAMCNKHLQHASTVTHISAVRAQQQAVEREGHTVPVCPVALWPTARQSPVLHEQC